MSLRPLFWIDCASHSCCHRDTGKGVGGVGVQHLRPTAPASRATENRKRSGLPWHGRGQRRELTSPERDCAHMSGLGTHHYLTTALHHTRKKPAVEMFSNLPESCCMFPGLQLPWLPDPCSFQGPQGDPRTPFAFSMSQTTYFIYLHVYIFSHSNICELRARLKICGAMVRFSSSVVFLMMRFIMHDILNLMKSQFILHLLPPPHNFS